MARMFTALAIISTVLCSCIAAVVPGEQPRDLSESFRQLDSTLGPQRIAKIKAMPEQEFASLEHFGLGLWMRNKWWLWKEGQLAKTFIALGIDHPDSMSEIILRSYHRYLTGRPIELSGLIDETRSGWRDLHLRMLMGADSVR